LSDNAFSTSKLIKEIAIHALIIIVGSGLAELAGKLLSATPGTWAIITFVAITLLSGILIRRKFGRFLKLRNAGVNEYYYTFEDKENKTVFSDLKTTFCYLGISGNTIFKFYKAWHENNPDGQAFFLLMDPSPSAFERQIAFREGVSLDTPIASLNSELQKKIKVAVDAENSKIEFGIKQLKTINAYTNGKLEIRLHKGFIPWWMYIVDNEKIYLGILEKGVDGSKSSVIAMKRLEKYGSPFDAYKNLWNTLWAEAQKIS
jgi:hypothetical protein